MVIATVRVWLDSYPEDFYDPPLHSTLHQLIFFAQRRLPDSELLIKAKHKLQRLFDEDKEGKIATSLTGIHESSRKILYI